MGCVYIAKNKINGKCYIGKTIQSLKQRKREHKATINSTRHINIPFRNALRKYGFDNFKWKKLYRNLNNKKLIEKEIYFIKKYNTKSPFGYNLTDGGEGVVNYKHSKETKNKMRGRKRTKEARQKMRVSHKGLSYNIGRKASAVTCKKISNALIGRKVPQYIIEKIRKANKGQTRSEDALKNMRGCICSEEKKEKISKALKGHLVSEKTKIKMRKPKSEEAKRNMRKPKSEEHKKNMSKAAKRRRAG